LRVFGSSASLVAALVVVIFFVLVVVFFMASAAVDGLRLQAGECSTLSMGKANQATGLDVWLAQAKKAVGQVAIATGVGDNGQLASGSSITGEKQHGGF
jgi:hypothetical protein